MVNTKKRRHYIMDSVIDRNNQLYYCPECGLVFSEHYSLEEHLLKEHKIEIEW